MNYKADTWFSALLRKEVWQPQAVGMYLPADRGVVVNRPLGPATNEPVQCDGFFRGNDICQLCGKAIWGLRAPQNSAKRTRQSLFTFQFLHLGLVTGLAYFFGASHDSFGSAWGVILE